MISDTDAEASLRRFFEDMTVAPDERDVCAGLSGTLRHEGVRDGRPSLSRTAFAIALVGAVVAVTAGVVAVHLGRSGPSGGASGSMGEASPSPSVPGAQLDLLFREESGTGNQTTVPTYFPHARYTFFTFSDPSPCLEAVVLLDATGVERAQAVVAPPTMSRPGIPSLPAQTPMPDLVQNDLPAGEYRLQVRTFAGRCAWMIEEVLNSMSSTAPAPVAMPLPAGPDVTSTVTDGRTTIPIPVAGVYRVAWTITGPRGGVCSGGIALRTAAGDVESLVSPGAAVVGLDGSVPTFLAAGRRTVDPPSGCTWRVSVSPWFGTAGGGVQGFARTPPT